MSAPGNGKRPRDPDDEEPIEPAAAMPRVQGQDNVHDEPQPAVAATIEEAPNGGAATAEADMAVETAAAAPVNPPAADSAPPPAEIADDDEDEDEEGSPEMSIENGGGHRADSGPDEQPAVAEKDAAAAGAPQANGDGEGFPEQMAVNGASADDAPAGQPPATGGFAETAAPDAAGGAFPAQSSQARQAQQAQNKLKVEDALSYLDQVRLQFEDQPQVYNDFLDIMKEFKSSNIDTPGVISRVSELFEGHTDLIVGFNTFLPPGYKIEVPEHGMPGQILVTVTDGSTLDAEGRPTGTTYVQHSRGSQMHQYNKGPGGMMPQGLPMGGGHQQQQQQQQHQQFPMQMMQQPMQGGRQQMGAGAMQQQQQQQPRGQAPPMGGPPMGGPQMGGGPPGQKSQVEFANAINYVNKIKSRFERKPRVYKDFLEILHTYQKEAKEITLVYEQVKRLFENEQDLLEEFSQFLPEANAEHMAHKRREEEERLYQASKMQKGGKSARTLGKPRPRANQMELHMQELTFFDKVAKAVKNKRVYENFLRCLNLYCHEIINREELVELVSGFLSKFPSLLQWFKNYVGVQDRVGALGQQADIQPDLDLRTCKQLDRSYRQLPDPYVKRECSGRTDLDPGIAKTLNDEWVSFPTWSEESSFLASKKNVFEEAIFRCEDERFELDIIIEANLATIRCLDMVVKSLEEMSEQEQRAFKFPIMTLGGNSEFIHRAAVTRLYGDRAPDVFAAMDRDPLNAIPLVLKRLKQKNVEWRMTQRQWNQIWRELHEKNYLRSLDYQGPSFKRTDPLIFKPKALREKMIETRDQYRSWKQAQADAGEGERQGENTDAPEPPRPVMTFHYSDDPLLGEVARLVVYAARRITSTSESELAAIQTILESFVPEVVGATPTSPCSADAFSPLERKPAPAAVDGEATNGSGSPDDAAAESNGDAAAMETDAAAAPTTDVPNGEAAAPKVDDKADEKAEEAPGSTSPNTKVFYANRHWFVLFRLHQIVYERVREIKAVADGIARKHAERAAAGTTAVADALSLRGMPEYPPDGYFEAFIETTEKLIDGRIDLAAYEETMLEMFSIVAYKTFTLDRLLTTCARKLDTLVKDDNSRALAGLYLRSREGGFNYRDKAYDILGDLPSAEHHFFRVEHLGEQVLEMELIDFELEDEEGAAEDWVDYVDNKLPESGDGGKAEDGKGKVFLDRSKKLAESEKAMDGVTMSEELQCKLDVNTYKMGYVAGSSDFMHRSKGGEGGAAVVNGARSEKFKDFLAKWQKDNVGEDEEEAHKKWIELGTAADITANGTAMETA